MGQFKGPYLMFLIHNKEHNILTWKGVSKFIDTKFSSLGTLKMNGNHIGNNATKFFIKINLPMLNELHLGNLCLMKKIVILGMKDVKIYSRGIGIN